MTATSSLSAFIQIIYLYNTQINSIINISVFSSFNFFFSLSTSMHTHTFQPIFPHDIRKFTDRLHQVEQIRACFGNTAPNPKKVPKIDLVSQLEDYDAIQNIEIFHTQLANTFTSHKSERQVLGMGVSLCSWILEQKQFMIILWGCPNGYVP